MWKEFLIYLPSHAGVTNCTFLAPIGREATSTKPAATLWANCSKFQNWLVLLDILTSWANKIITLGVLSFQREISPRSPREVKQSCLWSLTIALILLCWPVHDCLRLSPAKVFPLSKSSIIFTEKQLTRPSWLWPTMTTSAWEPLFQFPKVRLSFKIIKQPRIATPSYLLISLMPCHDKQLYSS